MEAPEAGAVLPGGEGGPLWGSVELRLPRRGGMGRGGGCGGNRWLSVGQKVGGLAPTQGTRVAGDCRAGNQIVWRVMGGLDCVPAATGPSADFRQACEEV